MSTKRASARVLELPGQIGANPSHELSRPYVASLVEETADGTLVVCDGAGRTQPCDWLASSAEAGPRLEVGDPLLVQPVGLGRRPVVLGRIGRYPAARPSVPAPHLKLESTESLSLKCGEASIDLRADGKVMIRGEEVLIRAKGTQRIRAGTVSIN